MEKRIGHKKRKKKDQKQEKRRQKVTVEARTRNGIRSEKKKGRVRKVLL